MSGLVFRDLFLYCRKVSKAVWITEAAALLLFAAVMPKNVYSIIGYIFMITPINIVNLTKVFKEIDEGCQGLKFVRTLPYTKKEIVRARFLTAFLIHAFYTLCMSLFSAIHSLRSGMDPVIYVKGIAAIWLAGIIILSVDIFLGFFSKSNLVMDTFNFIVLFLLVGLSYAGVFSGSIDGSYEVFAALEPYVYWTLGTIAVLSAAGSYNISLKII